MLVYTCCGIKRAIEPRDVCGVPTPLEGRYQDLASLAGKHGGDGQGWWRGMLSQGRGPAQ